MKLRPRPVRNALVLPASSRDLVCVCVALWACALAAGCGSGSSRNDHTPSTSAGNSATASESSAGFPLQIVDDLDRKTTLNRPPRRIVSLAPSATEILFALGAGDRVIGVTEYCTYPPEAATRTKVAGYTVTISQEALVGLRPDLVVTMGMSFESIIDQLDRFEIPLVALDPQTLDDVYANIGLIGRITGEIEQAELLASRMRKRVQQVQAVAEQIHDGERVRVFYFLWEQPLLTAAPGSLIDEMITLAGGENVVGKLPQRYPSVSEEVVLRADPDVILMPSGEDQQQRKARLLERPGWESLQAVKSGRIYFVQEDLVSRPGPRLVDGLVEMARALYPARFADLPPAATSDDSPASLD